MHINRGLVFWGVALITAGAVALAIQAGAVVADTALELWRYWPVVLILIGLAIIAARTPLALIATLVAAVAVGGLAGTLVGGFPDGLSVGCGGEPTDSLTESGTFPSAATVQLTLDCGSLDVTTADGSEWTVDARTAGGASPRIEASDASLRVAADDGDGPFPFDDRQAWDVVLPADADLDVSVEANAAATNLDLADGSFTGLSIDANAGEVNVGLAGASVEGFSVDANAGAVSIDTDGATTLDGSVEMNAGSLELCVPEGVALAITMEDDNVTFSHNLDESGLRRDGDTWRIGDGAPAIALDLDGNAAGFTLNPPEGCS